MTIITKAALAAELGITKARVSQYVKAGLPVRSDGKLDREAAVKWVAASHASDGRPRRAGVNRAAAIVKSAKPEVLAKVLTPHTDAMLMDGLAEIVGRAGPMTVEAAVKLGIPTRSAFVLDQLISKALQDAAEAVLDRAGVERREDALGEAVGPTYWASSPNWHDLAAKGGEPFDEGAWQAAADKILEQGDA